MFLEFLGLKGGGGGLFPHKSESIDMIVMKLGGWVKHYLINYNRIHALMMSRCCHNDIPVNFSKNQFFLVFSYYFCAEGQHSQKLIKPIQII